MSLISPIHALPFRCSPDLLSKCLPGLLHIMREREESCKRDIELRSSGPIVGRAAGQQGKRGEESCLESGEREAGSAIVPACAFPSILLTSPS